MLIPSSMRIRGHRAPIWNVGDRGRQVILASWPLGFVSGRFLEATGNSGPRNGQDAWACLQAVTEECHLGGYRLDSKA